MKLKCEEKLCTRLEYANSIASCDNWRRASIRWWSATSSKCWLDSKRRLSIEERTGRSASTAAVLGTSDEVLFSTNGRDDFKEPPFVGFSPRIHARCCWDGRLSIIQTWNKSKSIGQVLPAVLSELYAKQILKWIRGNELPLEDPCKNEIQLKHQFKKQDNFWC